MSTLNPVKPLIESLRLANGVRLVTETMPQARTVSVGVWVDSGARMESADECGLAHFIEHMLFKGTTRRTAADIAREMDSLGGNLDAYTSKEQVCYSVKVLDEHLEKAFDILADLTLHPRFEQEDIEKEKGVIFEELKMEEDNPEYLVHEMFASAFWKGHALGRPILGTRKTVRGFTQEKVRGFYERQYHAGNLVITAAGNITAEQLYRLAAKEFGGVARWEAEEKEAPPTSRAGIRQRSKRSLEQVHITLGVPFHEMTHPRRYAGYVLNLLLGGGMSSRLFQNIREERGLAYAIFSELGAYRDAGALTVYAGTSRETACEVIRLMVEEMRRFREELVTEEELRRAKDHLKGAIILGLETPASRMANLARQELYFGRTMTLEEVMEAVESVTRQEVRDVAEEAFQGRQACLALLGNLTGFEVDVRMLEF